MVRNPFYLRPRDVEAQVSQAVRLKVITLHPFTVQEAE